MHWFSRRPHSGVQGPPSHTGTMMVRLCRQHPSGLCGHVRPGSLVGGTFGPVAYATLRAEKAITRAAHRQPVRIFLTW